MNEADALAATIEVVQGRRELEPRWVPLVETFAAKYGMSIVNVTTDDVTLGGSRGRLCLWGATAADADALKRPSGNYDSKRQARASELAPGGPWFVFSADYETEAFRAFVGSGGTPELRQQARELLADERIWRVDSSLGTVVIFLYTDEQRDNLSATDRAAWENILWEWYLSLAAPGLARREQFRVNVDSKQNIDENYEGITFYCWRR